MNAPIPVAAQTEFSFSHKSAHQCGFIPLVSNDLPRLFYRHDRQCMEVRPCRLTQAPAMGCALPAAADTLFIQEDLIGPVHHADAMEGYVIGKVVATPSSPWLLIVLENKAVQEARLVFYHSLNKQIFALDKTLQGRVTACCLTQEYNDSVVAVVGYEDGRVQALPMPMAQGSLKCSDVPDNLVLNLERFGAMTSLASTRTSQGYILLIGTSDGTLLCASLRPSSGGFSQPVEIPSDHKGSLSNVPDVKLTLQT